MDFKDRYELVKPYLLWFLIPFVVIYGLDFIKAVLSLVQFMAALVCVGFAGSLIAGFVVELLDVRNEIKDKDSYVNMRLFKYIPMFVWGKKLVRWLMQDGDKESNG